jgi:hypothetical protein
MRYDQKFGERLIIVVFILITISCFIVPIVVCINRAR